MPTNVPLSEEHKENILKGQGLCQDTKDRRLKAFNHFQEFIKGAKGLTGNFELKKAVMEEQSVTREDVYEFYKDYILSYRVQKDVKKKSDEEEPAATAGNLDLPRFKTIEGVKSHLKMSCITELKLDLTDRVEFPEEASFWRDYLKHLKEHRKMKIDHFKSVSPDVLDGAYELFAAATAAYNARGQVDYHEYLAKIPLEWKDKYHYILQWGPMWFATLLEINRGREGIQDLLVSDFQKYEDPILELKYWIKVEQGVTKTDQRSLDGDVEDRGFLPYWDFYPGCNPGKMFEEHLSRLPPDCKYLFSLPKKLGLKLHDPSVTILYENIKVGKHTINRMVSTMCKLTNAKEHFTNHDLRATGLVALKKADFDFEEIKKVSGHKSTKSIEENYHIGLETKKKADMMFCVLNASKLGRGDNFVPISKHLKRKNLKTVNSALPPEQVACSSVTNEQEMDLEADLDMSESELDDSFIDADWKPPEANFELQFESSEDEMDEPPKKKKSMINRAKTYPRARSTPAVVSTSSPPPPSQPLLKPVTEKDVREALGSLKIKKVCLSQIRVSQPGLVPLPKDMITCEIEAADLLFIKCLQPGQEQSSYSPLSMTDGDLPVPTLKWTIAKSKNMKVVNGKFLLDWFQDRKVPDLDSSKYLTAGVCSETKKVTKPDPNPEKLFSGWFFNICKFQEPEFSQEDLERIILNTGGKLVSDDKAKSFPTQVVVLGDGNLGLPNKVLCPSYIIQCVQEGKILCEKDYIYVNPVSDQEVSSPQMKIKLNVKKPAELPAKKDDQPCSPQPPFFGHYPSPQFYPPSPFHYNFPYNPFFPYAQQFPVPLNYPLAGQAHLMSGPGQAHLMGGPAYPMMGHLPPAGLALPTGAHQPVLNHPHHGGLQPGRADANLLGSTAAPCPQQPSGQVLGGAQQPLSVRSDIQGGVFAQQVGGTAQQGGGSAQKQGGGSAQQQGGGSAQQQVGGSAQQQGGGFAQQQGGGSAQDGVTDQGEVSAAVSSQNSGADQITSRSQSQVWVKVLSRNRGVTTITIS